MSPIAETLKASPSGATVHGQRAGLAGGHAAGDDAHVAHGQRLRAGVPELVEQPLHRRGGHGPREGDRHTLPGRGVEAGPRAIPVDLGPELLGGSLAVAGRRLDADELRLEVADLAAELVVARVQVGDEEREVLGRQLVEPAPRALRSQLHDHEEPEEGEHERDGDLCATVVEADVHGAAEGLGDPGVAGVADGTGTAGGRAYRRRTVPAYAGTAASGISA